MSHDVADKELVLLEVMTRLMVLFTSAPIGATIYRHGLSQFGRVRFGSDVVGSNPIDPISAKEYGNY